MGNPYFSFKQFTIQQQHCAMKVCTDACLFGAWVANRMQLTQPLNILDIGTGTGLLPLMLAQKTAALIDTVEFDQDAFMQASQNIADCGRSGQITIYHQQIQQFNPGKQYEFIISNPPFYQNDLKGPSQQKNVAHHSSQLSFEVLLASIQRLLLPTGSFALLLPANRASNFMQLASQQGYHTTEIVRVKQTEKHAPFRWMIWFGSQPKLVIESELVIKQHSVYSAEFIHLLQDYYLHL